MYVVPVVSSTNDAMALRCLLCLLHNSVVSLSRSVLTTEFVTLYVRRIEESARTLVVLDVDGYKQYKERFLDV